MLGSRGAPGAGAGKGRGGAIVIALVAFVVGQGAMYLWMQSSGREIDAKIARLEDRASAAMKTANTAKMSASESLDAAMRRPEDSSEGEHDMEEMQRRLQLLEDKTNGYMSWASDPFLSTRVRTNCKSKTNFVEYGCEGWPKNTCPGSYDLMACLDNMPPKKPKPEGKKCIVYDFGIRENPEYGHMLSRPPFDCDVYAFDPSPITKKWFKGSRVDNLPNYKMFFIGAGAAEGEIELHEYNWGQISLLRYPEFVMNASDCPGFHCKLATYPTQAVHRLPVTNLKAVMKMLGHDYVDIVKLDVEGSEYLFLEAMVDDGTCNKVGQVNLEWHHYDWDPRYGWGASPHLNALVRSMERCGLKQYWIHSKGGWPILDKVYVDMKIDVRCNLAGFMREQIF